MRPSPRIALVLLLALTLQNAAWAAGRPLTAIAADLALPGIAPQRAQALAEEAAIAILTALPPEVLQSRLALDQRVHATVTALNALPWGSSAPRDMAAMIVYALNSAGAIWVTPQLMSTPSPLLLGRIIAFAFGLLTAGMALVSAGVSALSAKDLAYRAYLNTHQWFYAREARRLAADLPGEDSPPVLAAAQFIEALEARSVNLQDAGAQMDVALQAAIEELIDGRSLALTQAYLNELNATICNNMLEKGQI